MSLEVDQEILEDFLIEAGEILEQLSEQLVELEQRQDDRDLLNAIFRGFHTVKGGAGFLQLDPMVETCHKAENLFDELRNGHLTVSAELMDAVLQSLDAVNTMFEMVRMGEAPQPADAELLHRLQAFAAGQITSSAQTSGEEPAQNQVTSSTDAIESEPAVNPNSASDD